MSTTKAAYSIPTTTLESFKAWCGAQGMIPTTVITGCMRALASGDLKWFDGKPIGGQVAPTTSFTPVNTPTPQEPQKSRGRPKAPRVNDKGEPVDEYGHTAEQSATFRRRGEQWAALSKEEKEAAEGDMDWHSNLSPEGRYIPYIEQQARDAEPEEDLETRVAQQKARIAALPPLTWETRLLLPVCYRDWLFRMRMIWASCGKTHRIYPSDTFENMQALEFLKLNKASNSYRVDNSLLTEERIPLEQWVKNAEAFFDLRHSTESVASKWDAEHGWRGDV